MSNQDYGAFIVKILSTLEKSGYPDKKVSLPLEAMYEAAYSKGLNFNKVLDFLAEKGTLHKKTTHKIIFFAKTDTLDSASNESKSQEKPDMAGMMAQAQEMIKQMSPQQISDLQEMYANMDETQKEAILKHAKDKGLL